MSKREQLQADVKFMEKLRDIQKNIMKNKGEFVSLTKITQNIITLPEFKDIEKKLMGDLERVTFNINFDRRKQ